ncbi:MAG TPA: hypothetical protein VGN17_03600 [Bryobacteraceae bacterium]|jgi:hypothetical protein
MREGVRTRIAGWQSRSLLAGLSGVLLCVTAFLLDRTQFLRSYLFAYMFWTGMAMGCLGILLLHHTVGGKWGMVIRRLCEAGARTLPYMAILFLPIAAAIPVLYVWARPEAAADALLAKKAAYLNVPFFLVRAAAYFAIWTLYASLLSRWSAEQDRTGDPRLMGRMRAASAPGLVVFTVTATFAFVDWVMSLEPHWFSTVYGAMFLMGEVLEAFALVIALVIVLSQMEPLRHHVTPQHLHDLGNMMFAFTVLWAYLAFSQYLIIWAGNLPEEIPWYVRRLGQGWGAVAVIIVLFHFCVPFLLLLQRDIKRHARRLFRVCMLLIVVRLIDVYWVVKPSFENRIHVQWTDFVTPLSVGGLWLALFFWQLNRTELVPIKDPRLEGTPRETVAF